MKKSIAAVAVLLAAAFADARPARADDVTPLGPLVDWVLTCKHWYKTVILPIPVRDENGELIDIIIRPVQVGGCAGLCENGPHTDCGRDPDSGECDC